MKIKYLTKEELNDSINIIDLSDRSNGIHAINLMMDQILSDVKLMYNIDTHIIRNNPVVNVLDNYDNLYYPDDTITKSSIYTRWVDDKHILRTQTTSGIPGVLRSIKESGLYLLPGLVYRRDVIDRNHVGEPHQLDIWNISRDKRYGRKELLELVEVVVNSIMPGAEWRYNETSHYYTKDGIEVEILKDGKWLEILECGEILPRLLKDNGLDPNVWSGLAMGIGLDRSVMIKKDIRDIRVLRSADRRISKQMCNLDIYREVSNYPPVSSDISIAVSNEMNDELIGDKIRTSIKNVNWIEEVSIKSETNYSDLPLHVSQRLGMTSDMKNVLVRVVIRSLDGNLTKQQSNDIIKDLYQKVHEGNIGYL